jgi:methionyl-tRNA synthetase
MNLEQTSHKQNKYTLTTPLYYVNDVPHIGSAYTTMAADALARSKHLQGYEVLLITGTDEHGQKIQRTAESRGLSPQVHCDEIVETFDRLWQELNIQYDRFSRTTDPRHEAIVREFFQRVWDQGDIYLSQQQGWYCVQCEEFKEERELLPDHYCAIHTNQVAEWRDEENYFFRLSKYQSQLEELYTSQPDFIQPESRRKEVLNFVAQGLTDFSISRINLDWGFPIPIDTKHTIYVWFDALLGYVTALLEPEDEPTLANALKKWYPFDLHLIGKDILRFHAVYWQAMLMSAGLPTSKKVFGHGFLTKDGQKMGKSLGNTLDPIELVNKYGADAIRYYFLKEIEFGKDGDFNETRFIDILNADLANDLGNLLNRSSGMVHKYFQGTIPPVNFEVELGNNPLREIAENLGDRVINSYDSLAFSRVCQEIFTLIRAGNKYIDDQAPWKLYKQGEMAIVALVLASVLESVRLGAYLLSPIVPGLSSSIYQQLGFNVNFNDSSQIRDTLEFSTHSSWGLLATGQTLLTPKPIFQKLEPLQLE